MKRSRWQLLCLAITILFIVIVNASTVEKLTHTTDDHHRHRHHKRPFTKTIVNCSLAKKQHRHQLKTINRHHRIHTSYVCHKAHHTTKKTNKHVKHHKTKKHHSTDVKHHRHHHSSHRTSVHHHKTIKSHHANKKHRKDKEHDKKHRGKNNTTKKHNSTVTKPHHTKKIHRAKSDHHSTIINSHKVSATSTVPTAVAPTPGVTNGDTPGSVTITLEGFEPTVQPAAIQPTPAADRQAPSDNSSSDDISAQGIADSSSSDNSSADDSSSDNQEPSPTEDQSTGTTIINPTPSGGSSASGGTGSITPDTQVSTQAANNGPSVDAEPQSKIIGISVGAVAGCVAAAGLAGMFIYRRRQDKEQQSEVEPDEHVNTRWRTQSFMAVVAGAVAKLPKRSDSSGSNRSRGVLGTIRRAASKASSTLSRSGSRSSQQSYGIAVSGPMPPIAHVDEQRYHSHAY
ncbi:hypothetical protein BCV72DRAFT_336652 [Rhizopus microsporus var. microsporus]|uniref:Mid2 domain-containing protein n=2 Tax=Rhizopus microsporus TaxID=58291 RepID=A0A2G4T336_RHIZD|nr:uncharacterized protein RHIMIDRAFT_289833 [Rhizopus microsporus ATCC 52813]ORE05326.1 hypothetical protein BCV72DRAFT_336652 [Rhizopus microsporus var. microsporus]PHZ15425.1 hypothetical protein RHIMIDRAFT_289833 [Rhizopus microsporus ATCC 52813]